jgi:hypothetical protein
MRGFVCFFAFFGAKIWPAAAGTGELARDLRDQTRLAALESAFRPNLSLGTQGYLPQSAQSSLP